jgi:hypothetical protein
MHTPEAADPGVRQETSMSYHHSATTPEDTIPDNLLRTYATSPAAGQLHLGAEDVALLQMTLPDICSELLAYRLAHRAWRGMPGAAAGRGA